MNRIVTRVTYRGREYIVDQGQRTVRLRIPPEPGSAKLPILRRIDWHGPTARAVKLRANYEAQKGAS